MFEKTIKISVLFAFAFFLLGIGQVYAQEISFTEGVVSYITGQNIYVKFANTEKIENGDTLFVQKNEVLVPALVVQHHSSISCLCNPIGEQSFKVSDKIIAKRWI